MYPHFDEWKARPNGDALPTTATARPVSRPQAPVLVVGRGSRFLDVQPSVHDAEQHLAAERLTGALDLDSCDLFDGCARPLRTAVERDGTVVLHVASDEARPEELRERVNGLLAAALETYEPDQLPIDSRIDEEALRPLRDEFSFPHFLDALDRRFNDAYPSDGAARHVAGRLHNFWHAVGG